MTVLALALAAFSPLRAQQGDEAFVDAVTAYSYGLYAKARINLEALVAANPANDAAWYYLGLTNIGEKNYQEAAKCISKAAELDRNNYWYRHYFARLVLATEDSQSAIAVYEELVKDFPDRNNLSYELLDLYMGAKDYDKALKCIDDIETARGYSEMTVRTRYQVLEQSGQQEKAIEVLEQFNSEYASAELLSLTGDGYLADYRDSLALCRYKEALALDSRYMPAVLGMSEVYRHMRRYDDYFSTLEGLFTSADVPVQTKGMYLRNVVKSLDPKMIRSHLAGYDSLAVKALRMHPADSTLLQDAGAFYYATGQKNEAGECFLKATLLYPESISLCATHLQFLALEEDWEAVMTASQDAYRRFDDPGFLDYSSMAAFNVKDYDTVISNGHEILSRYKADKQRCVNAWSAIGDAYHEKGNSKAAYKAYDKALRLNPDFVPVLNNYAYYLSIEGKKLKKAYAMSKKTVEAEPDNATYLDTFGWILHLMGKDLEAKPFFKHAMLYGGKDSAVILHHYAEVLSALGETSLAKTYENMAAAREKQ